MTSSIHKVSVSKVQSVLALGVLIVTALAASTGSAAPLNEVKTGDGQVMRCENSADLGRVSYRVLSASGLIKAGHVEVTIGFETLKCDRRQGVFGFVVQGLSGRNANAHGGFVEFSGLDLVGYTPDLAIVRSNAVSLTSGSQQVTFVAPVSGFSGLLSRNVNGNRDRRVVLTALLRGQASMGDIKTGRVQTRAVVPFGTFGVVLSEANQTLRFAEPASESNMKLSAR